MSSTLLRTRSWLWLVVLAGLGFSSPDGQGAGVVTNASFADLVQAMEGGGLVQLRFDGTIQFEYTIDVVFNTTMDTVGRRVVLSGNDTRRLFNVPNGIEFSLSGVTLDGGSSPLGGAIYIDGGTLIATNCIFSNNKASGSAGVNGKSGENRQGEGQDGSDGSTGSNAQGGAIYNRGVLRLYECQFESNQAAGGAGGSGGNGGSGAWRGGNGGDGGDGGVGLGGAIYSATSAWLTNCTLGANTSQGGLGGEGGTNGQGMASYSGGGGIGGSSAGGAIYSAGSLFVVNSTFAGNKTEAGNAGSRGGFVNGGAAGAKGPAGGNAYGGAIENLGNVTVLQCTFNANQAAGGIAGGGGAGSFGGAEGGDGGDAYGGGMDNAGIAAITNCTFAAGSATGGNPGQTTAGGSILETQGEVGLSRGGNLAARSGSLRLKNTILAYAESGKNGFGTLVDAGYNLSSDDSFNFTGFVSKNKTDPKLGPLGDYGGPTQTMNLLIGSPALDKAAAVAGLDADQRGSARPAGMGYDIGAYEAAVFSISGRVLAGSTGVSGVQINLSSTNLTRTAQTDSSGVFEFENLFADVYRISPAQGSAGYTPPFRMVHLDWLAESAVNQDFSITPSRITDLQFDGARRIIAASGTPQRTYRLQASPDLSHWDNVATNLSSASGSLQLIDQRTVVDPQQFYRLEQP